MTDRHHPKHRAFIRSLPCCVCACSAPSECAHVSMRHFGGATIPYTEQKFKGKNGKTHDKWTVPLCMLCHYNQHVAGEHSFWRDQGINPLELAKALWANTGNLTAARGILYRAREGQPI